MILEETTFHRYSVITDSSALHEVDYDPTTEKLRVKFVHGASWIYEGVPAHLYSLIIGSNSPGKYYNWLIKGKFNGVKEALV